MKSFLKRASLLVAGLVLGAMSRTAVAQAEVGARLPVCVSITRDVLKDQLVAICRGRALTLGAAESYQTIENRRIEAMIVDLVQNGERRVLMISFPDGKPLIEDLTGTLAISAGRGPMMGVSGLEIDLGTFAVDGEVGVREPAGKSGRIDFGEQMAAEAARRAASSLTN